MKSWTSRSSGFVCMNDGSGIYDMENICGMVEIWQFVYVVTSRLPYVYVVVATTIRAKLGWRSSFIRKWLLHTACACFLSFLLLLSVGWKHALTCWTLYEWRRASCVVVAMCGLRRSDCGTLDKTMTHVYWESALWYGRQYRKEDEWLHLLYGFVSLTVLTYFIILFHYAYSFRYLFKGQDVTYRTNCLRRADSLQRSIFFSHVHACPSNASCYHTWDHHLPWFAQCSTVLCGRPWWCERPCCCWLGLVSREPRQRGGHGFGFWNGAKESW